MAVAWRVARCRGHDQDRTKVALGAGASMHPAVEAAAERLHGVWPVSGRLAAQRPCALAHLAWTV